MYKHIKRVDAYIITLMFMGFEPVASKNQI
jgi:hypothetical protein